MIIIFICFIVYLCITLCIGFVNAKVNPSGARELAEFHPKRMRRAKRCVILTNN